MRRPRENGVSEDLGPVTLKEESRLVHPDVVQYPHLRECPFVHLQFRMALICTLNQRLHVQLQNTEMALVHEWWSLAFKLRQLRTLIFTPIKLDYIREYNPDMYGRYPEPFRVTIDR